MVVGRKSLRCERANAGLFVRRFHFGYYSGAKVRFSVHWGGLDGRDFYSKPKWSAGIQMEKQD